jgi:hypothetical protein
MVGRVGVWDGDVREASRRKKASFRFIARGIVNGGSRQAPVADTVWARDGTYLVARYDAVGTLVVSTQKAIVFEQLGLERVTQRADYIGWHVVSGDPVIDSGAVKVRLDCRG